MSCMFNRVSNKGTATWIDAVDAIKLGFPKPQIKTNRGEMPHTN